MHSTHLEPNHYLRPLYVSIAFSIAGEAFILVVFGMFLFPGGNIINKVLWTLLFCGVGMGATMGALINIFIVNRTKSPAISILITATLSALVLGISCNLLCLNLDMNFRYFGAYTNPAIFFVNGLVMSIVGGLIAGWLLFTPRGNSLLEKVGI